MHVCYSFFMLMELAFECSRTKMKSWVEWMWVIIILTTKQWGYNPACGMKMIGKPEVDLLRPTGLNPPLFHHSTNSMLLVLLTLLKMIFWTPSKSRGSSGCKRTTWYTIIVETPRYYSRRCLHNANEPSRSEIASLHQLIHLMNYPCPTPPTILIMLDYTHYFTHSSAIIITYFYKCMNALLQRKEADNPMFILFSYQYTHWQLFAFFNGHNLVFFSFFSDTCTFSQNYWIRLEFRFSL